MSKQIKDLNNISEINEMMKELEARKAEIAKTAKKETKEAIKKILDESGFTLEELFPKLAKNTPEASSSANSTTVQIGDKEFEIKARGAISKDVQAALKAVKKDPSKYDKAKIIEEFGAK